ncbi:hypothetical protein C0Q70_11821 [Pomacea canaliculata]|uniref:Ribitol-5-phosphate transferase n=1 Tax=Pomacea canaliculata TaxID=400727 RepID=A0A2T7P722_POMCA|nr:fukutin-related protein-like [Pomacea canaliculata]XP_025098187.1 fukutin-related protein-like [Pomacea canaliculata]PVD29224.1 hypothetical protein C0Q70_11821 [Pomacea canaliculata]
MWKYKSWKTCLTASLALNLVAFIYLGIQQHYQSTHDPRMVNQPQQEHRENAFDPHHPVTPVTELVTVIIRDFEDFENALVETVSEIQNVLGHVKTLIVGNKFPYPPLKLDKTWNVEVVSLATNLLHNFSSSRPDHLIKTKFVLVLPDAAKFKHWKNLQSAMQMLRSTGKTKAVAMRVGGEPLSCMTLDVDLRLWQMMILAGNSTSGQCDMMHGEHALLMLASDFLQLADPFASPFPPCFYIMAKLRQWKIRNFDKVSLARIKELFTDPHNKWKHKRLEEDRLTKFYYQAGIKLVIHSDGRKEYYGCTKSTARCFGTIVDDMPEYLYEGRWTPPCCLRALRETARYVFEILDKENVRYWLEGGSLLGAARNGDIIPWDYDVDIGIYRDDIGQSSHLKDAAENRFVDELGYVWEKGSEGDFFRVQYSEQNHLHVDIHPFYSRNGTMTKDTWFRTHRQDTEFPEHYLKPLTQINFVGMMASAPNNVKSFLEFKFGEGVIGQPRYPNFKKVQ